MIEVKTVIEHDDWPSDPREWDNLWSLACWHRRYDLGDPGAAQEVHEITDEAHPRDALEALEAREDYLTCRLYLYDHSGLRFFCRFPSHMQHASWDAGMVGIAFVSKEKLRKEFGWKLITRKRAQKAYEILEAEVSEYDRYVSGDSYCYRIEDSEGNILDSCCGYPYNQVEKAAEEAAAYWRERLESEAPSYEHMLEGVDLARAAMFGVPGAEYETFVLQEV